MTHPKSQMPHASPTNSVKTDTKTQSEAPNQTTTIDLLSFLWRVELTWTHGYIFNEEWLCQDTEWNWHKVMKLTSISPGQNAMVTRLVVSSFARTVSWCRRGPSRILNELICLSWGFSRGTLQKRYVLTQMPDECLDDK